MRPRTIIGIIFIVASLLKLATIWGFVHWSWFAQVTEQPWATYFCIFVVLYVGVHLIIDSYRRDPDQWLHRPLPTAATSTSIAVRPSMVHDSTPSAAESDWICARP